MYQLHNNYVGLFVVDIMLELGNSQVIVSTLREIAQLILICRAKTG